MEQVKEKPLFSISQTYSRSALPGATPLAFNPRLFDPKAASTREGRTGDYVEVTAFGLPAGPKDSRAAKDRQAETAQVIQHGAILMAAAAFVESGKRAIIYSDAPRPSGREDGSEYETHKLHVYNDDPERQRGNAMNAALSQAAVELATEQLEQVAQVTTPTAPAEVAL